ncbi:MAG: hypothetical protein U5J64_06705 [Halobacteriales archaeon]|nr:hypothetical protein [Halobacteriales archaeon]
MPDEVGTINTVTGRQIAHDSFTEEDVVLEDIAHGLAHNCRFAGQCNEFYSVALHSMNVSRCLDEVEGAGAELQLYGLLHDASEAYLADIPGPFKRSFEGYTSAEERVMDAVWEWSGLDSPRTDDSGREPWKDADEGVEACEMDALLNIDGGKVDAEKLEAYSHAVDVEGSEEFSGIKRDFEERAEELAERCGVTLR